MRILLLVIGMLVSLGQAAAIEPEHREVTVIKARVWDGYKYVETFLPSTAHQLTLLSGEDSAITFVRTEEYYWPLSRQIYVDFDKLHEPIDGILRIEQQGRMLAEVSNRDYSIVYPDGAVNGNASLLWGKEADLAFAAYEQSERDLSRRFVEAQRAQTLYQRALLEAGARRLAGGPVETIVPPPPLPEPSLRLVTTPTGALRVALEPGQYEISLWRDGRKVAGTERSLRVVDATKRSAVVADIIPEERWTRPLAANSAAARIFARPGTRFYLTLSEASRFAESDYLPVVSPQAEAVEGRDMWVRRQPFNAEAISLTGGSQTAILPLDRLKVEQTQGAAFGYTVRQAHAGEIPDLSAFTITVPADGDANRSEISLPAEAFRREVVVVRPRRAVLGLFLSFLPLCVAMAIAAKRRRKVSDA